MSDGSKDSNRPVQKLQATQPFRDRLRMREGYAMPVQPPSRGPVSDKPGSGVPPKAPK